MSVPELWLVRHAQTEWSEAGRHTGRTDVPLTAAGRAAAAQLPQRLGERAFALVLTSPLSRARDTCALAGYGDRAQLRDELMEWDYGEYEGRTTPEIRTVRPGWLLWRDGCPGGEQAADVGARVDRVIAEALQAGGDVALFAHGHVLRVLGARWLEQPPDFGARLALGTGAVSVLGSERGVRGLRVWGLTGRA
jgi:broad specificity phosphatase PhoE